MLVDKLAETFAVGFRIGKNDHEAGPIVHELLQQLAHQSRTQVEKLGAQIGFANDESAVLHAGHERVRNVFERADGRHGLCV